MNYIIAPDSYKNALPAPAVAAALARGIRQAQPDSTCVEIPLADGGEGFVRAVGCAAGGKLQSCSVTDPLGRPVEAEYALLPDGVAVIEVAAAAGLELLKPDERNPLRTSSFGVGELLRRLLLDGRRGFVVGLGGSATVDGGIGMLQALGATFFDADGDVLPPGAGGGTLTRVVRMEIAGLLPELACARFRIASDVTHPLNGERGAARVFAPQKGATPAMVAELEAGLANWSTVWAAEGMAPGDGAAGGLGFAFRHVFAGGMESGAEIVLDLANFDQRAQGAEWIVTGEGCSDWQTLEGKLCGVVAGRARKLGVPIILASGALAPGWEGWREHFAAAFSIALGPGELEEALRQTEANLVRMGHNIGVLTAKRTPPR